MENLDVSFIETRRGLKTKSYTPISQRKGLFLKLLKDFYPSVFSGLFSYSDSLSYERDREELYSHKLSGQAQEVKYMEYVLIRINLKIRESERYALLLRALNSKR